MSPRTCRTAFTLIEILVVIAIIAVLVGLLLPAIQKAREFAFRLQCQSNMRQIGIAMHAFHNDNNHFPPGSVSDTKNTGDYYGNWAIYLLPYIEQQNLYSNYTLTLLNWDTSTAGQGVVRKAMVKTYTCPSDPNGNQLLIPDSGNGGAGAAGQQYMTGAYRAIIGQGFAGNNYWDFNSNAGSLPGNSRGVMHVTWPGGPGTERISQITDGTANTLAVVERSTMSDTPRHGFWAYSHASYWSSSPINLSCILLNDYNACLAANPADDGPCKRGISSFHGTGFNALFCDDSAHWIDNSINLNVLVDLSTIAGGETIPGDF